MKRQNSSEDAMKLPPELAEARLPRYRRLRRNVVILTSLVALAPLIILTIINYLQDRDAYQNESRFAITQVVTNTKRNIEFVVEERQSALAMVIRDKSYTNLCSDSALAITLQNLKNSFGGFIDLGLIDDDGIQRYYTGPYDLKNREYKDQAWFHQVDLQGSFVSDVFMGHRNFPHFVIAIKYQRNLSSFYALRATIDMELLNQQIYSLDLDRYTDAFIITKEGVLQTESVFYGSVLSDVDIDVPTVTRNRVVFEEGERDGNPFTMGYAYIQGTPFVFVVIRQLKHPFLHWLGHRSDVLWFLILSAAMVLFVIIYGASNMAKQLREADLKRARAFHNIEYTNKMATIGRMAAGVAHEINNPMAIINEKAGLMKDLIGFSDDFPQREKTVGLVDSILKSVERCSRVTHRLLGFAKRMEIHKEQINLKELIEEVVGFQTTEISHRSIKVEYDIEDNLPLIDSDRGQLQQVLLNIINNAIVAVDDGGVITVSMAAHGGHSVTIAITDNGSGISEENLRNIFEPFFSTKGEFGTGLGLSITRDIVEKLGGKIDVNSVVGQGTRFIISVPLKKHEYGE